MSEEAVPRQGPQRTARPHVDPRPVAPDWVRLSGWSVAALAVALVHNRLWAAPNLDAFSTIAGSLGSDPFPETTSSDYLLTNLAMPVLGGITGMTEPHRYALLHLVVLVAGLGMCVVLAARRFGYLPARTLLVTVAVAPGVTVALQWLGQPDALTFPLSVALVLVQRRWAVAATSLLLGLSHPEQAVIIVAIAAAARAVALPPDRTSPPPGVQPLRATVVRLGHDLALGWVAVLIGRVVTELFIRASGAGGGTLRSDFLGMGFDMLLTHHTQAPGALVWFLWGPLWLGGAAAAVLLRRSRAGSDGRQLDRVGGVWWTLGALSVAALIPVWFTLDETRVYAMLTAPVLAVAAVLAGRALGASNPRHLLVLTLGMLAAALVIPGGFTAGTAAWATQIPQGDFLRFLLDGQHPGDNLFFWLLSPFDFVFPDLGPQ